MKKNKTIRPVMWILLIGLLGSCSPIRSVFHPVNGGNNPPPGDSLVQAAINISIDTGSLLSGQQTVFKVILPSGNKSVNIVRRRMEGDTAGHTAWYGEIQGDPGSFVLLSFARSAVAGRIVDSRGDFYRISYMGRGIHQIAKLNTRQFKESLHDYTEPPAPKGNGGNEADCPDPATEIQVMVVYTDAAETGAGGADGMEALIYQSVYLANLSYQNSNINQRLSLVHFEKVSYTETGVSMTDRDRLQNPTDGFMDNVPTLRNTYGADCVVLITESSDACGISYIMSPVSSAQEAYGYAVVTRSCSADNLSFPHELGHIMSARHDCTADPTLNSPYAYNHGYFVSTPADGSGSSWRTIMAYANCSAGPCTRIPYFSNPNLSYSPTGSTTATDPLGTTAGTCQSNNAQVLNNTAATVANFRCSSPSVTNVWMKDTWDDTGAEPDPHTAGELMYESPYIWVRNQQDIGLLHQYQHQNPIFGQQNWAYVKAHNGGGAISGTMNLYYANASVSLSWPGGWTLIGSIPVTFSPNSAQVIEFPWNSLPGTGHYCLLARWVSPSDPLAFPETSDVDYNTRQNNNIVWHNVNIISMGGDNDEMAEFNIVNLKPYPTRLTFEDAALFPKHNFTETGAIYIELDSILYEAWKKGGSKGAGISKDGQRLRLLAPSGYLDNITLPLKSSAKVRVLFHKEANTIKDKYLFRVRQFSKEREKESLVGGVSYDIYTYKQE